MWILSKPFEGFLCFQLWSWTTLRSCYSYQRQLEQARFDRVLSGLAKLNRAAWGLDFSWHEKELWFVSTARRIGVRNTRQIWHKKHTKFWNLDLSLKVIKVSLNSSAHGCQKRLFLPRRKELTRIARLGRCFSLGNWTPQPNNSSRKSPWENHTVPATMSTVMAWWIESRDLCQLREEYPWCLDSLLKFWPLCVALRQIPLIEKWPIRT